MRRSEASSPSSLSPHDSFKAAPPVVASPSPASSPRPTSPAASFPSRSSSSATAASGCAADSFDAPSKAGPAAAFGGGESGAAESGGGRADDKGSTGADEPAIEVGTAADELEVDAVGTSSSGLSLQGRRQRCQQMCQSSDSIRRKLDAPGVGEASDARLAYLDRPDNFAELARDAALFDLGPIVARLPVRCHVVPDADKLLVLVERREDDDGDANEVGDGRAER